MKRSFFIPCLLIAVVVFSFGTAFAQSDKEIIKDANNDLKNKNYEQAYSKIIMVAKPESGKVQDVLKEVYPKLIADYLTKASAIKVNTKDSLQVKHDKLVEIIGYLNDANAADSIFKKLAKADLYKSSSQKKKIDGSLTKNNKALKSVDDAIAKRNIPVVNPDSAQTNNHEAVQLIDTTSSTVNSNATEVTNNTNTTNVTNTNNATTTNSGEKKYYIIAGSYKSEADAQTAVNSLKALGYNNAEIVGQNAYGNYRISYSSFSGKEDAQTELEKIKTSVQADAWIFEK